VIAQLVFGLSSLPVPSCGPEQYDLIQPGSSNPPHPEEKDVVFGGRYIVPAKPALFSVQVAGEWGF